MILARLGFLPALALLPLASLGCSDPVPATPQAAWSISLQSPSFQDCPINGHTATMGEVNDHDKKTLLVDGTNGASVDCKVSGSGSFNVTASASQESVVAMSMTIPSISAGATLEAPAAGGVSFSSATTAGEPITSDTQEPCAFYFIPGTGEGVAEGKIWVAFQCPKMHLDTASGCRVAQGYAIYENCEN